MRGSFCNKEGDGRVGRGRGAKGAGMGEESGSSMADAALEACFSRLLEAQQAALFGFACGLLREREQARDVVQDTFVAAWHTAKRRTAPFGDPWDEEGIRRWLFAVTYRQAALLSCRGRRITWQSLDADTLGAALQALSAEDAACVLLQAVQGFSTEEIAGIVKLRPDAARKRLSRALQRLRAAYAAQLAPTHDR
jgi:RNA polymerase sigma-70 factor (ECF subfamily)